MRAAEERPGADGTVGTVWNRLLGIVGRTLIATGVILLLFVAYQLWGTGLAEANSQKELTEEFAESFGLEDPGSDDADAATIIGELAEVDTARRGPIEVPEEGDPGGFIEIPAIDLRTKTFVEGVRKEDLRKGPGHYPGTAFPGQPGNSAIAGHRSTYGAPFNRIDELVPGDEILVYTPQGEFTYRVLAPPADRGIEQGAGWYTVRPDDVATIAPTDDDRLTLTACHPKYSARQRIIVHAALVDEPAEPAPVTEAEAPSGPATDDVPPSASPEAVSSGDDLIAGDSSKLWPTILWGLTFLAIWAVGAELARRVRATERRAWPAYLAVVPISGVALWFCFVNLDQFLPSY